MKFQSAATIPTSVAMRRNGCVGLEEDIFRSWNAIEECFHYRYKEALITRGRLVCEDFAAQNRVALLQLAFLLRRGWFEENIVSPIVTGFFVAVVVIHTKSVEFADSRSPAARAAPMAVKIELPVGWRYRLMRHLHVPHGLLCSP